MSKKKIIAVIAFLLIGLMTYTFAATPENGLQEAGDTTNADTNNDNTDPNGDVLPEDEDDTDGEDEGDDLGLGNTNNPAPQPAPQPTPQPNPTPQPDEEDEDEKEEEDPKELNVPEFKLGQNIIGSTELGIYSLFELLISDDSNISSITLNDEVIATDVNTLEHTLLLSNDTNGIKEGLNTLLVCDINENCSTYEFTMDFTAPKIVKAANGVDVDGKMFKNNTSLQVSDVNLSTITNNDKAVEVDGDTVNFKIKSGGTFTIVATDLAGNKTESTFIIDKANPTVEVVDFKGDIDSKTFSELQLLIKDNRMINFIKLNGEFVVENLNGTSYDLNLNSLSDLINEGENTIRVTDVAGNTKKYVFTMDFTAPVISFTNPYETNYYQSGLELLDATAIESNITAEETYTYNTIIEYSIPYGEFTEVNTIDLSKVGIYKITVTATDLAGNSSTITHTLYNDYHYDKKICGALETDNCDMFIKPTIKSNGKVVTFMPNLIPFVIVSKGATLEYSAEAIELFNGQAFTAHTFRAEDIVIDSTNVDTSTRGKYTVKFSVTDWTNSTLTKSVTVIVV